EYQVTLRLGEFSPDPKSEKERRDTIERRWEAGRLDPLVIREGTKLQGLLRALKAEHSDTSWVVLHGGREFCEGLLQYCVALGPDFAGHPLVAVQRMIIVRFAPESDAR